MSKLALGRGLDSLLAKPGPRPDAPAQATDPVGVQLLLRGADGTDLVPPDPAPLPPVGQQELLPRWAFFSLLGMDLVLLVLAVWVATGPGDRSRLVISGIMVCLGGALLGLAIVLRGRNAGQDLETLNPLHEEKPRVRVRFLEERSRSGSPFSR